jgi:hypothetical protein
MTPSSIVATGNWNLANRLPKILAHSLLIRQELEARLPVAEDVAVFFGSHKYQNDKCKRKKGGYRGVRISARGGDFELGAGAGRRASHE